MGRALILNNNTNKCHEIYLENVVLGWEVHGIISENCLNRFKTRHCLSKFWALCFLKRGDFHKPYAKRYLEICDRLKIDSTDSLVVDICRFSSEGPFKMV